MKFNRKCKYDKDKKEKGIYEPDEKPRGVYTHIFSIFAPFFVPDFWLFSSKTTVFSPINKFSCPDPVFFNLRGLETLFPFSGSNFPQKRQLQTDIFSILGTFLRLFSYRPRSVLRETATQDKVT